MLLLRVQEAVSVCVVSHWVVLVARMLVLRVRLQRFFLCKVSNFQMNTKEWVYMLSLSWKQPCSFAAANTKTRATPEV